MLPRKCGRAKDKGRVSKGQDISQSKRSEYVLSVNYRLNKREFIASVSVVLSYYFF